MKAPKAEPREAALAHVECNTAGQQERIRQQAVKEKQDGTISQSERFIAKARELGLDEREEAFDAALAKVAKHRSDKL